MPARYALYFAPLAETPLARFGNHWLGRDAESGASLDQPALQGWDGARVRLLTEAPRHYGFHGTLKAPFKLAEGHDAEMLRRALALFAAGRKPFVLDGLQLQELGDFIALTPRKPAGALAEVADACVMELDSYRAPPKPDEIAKRQAAGLTARQQTLLTRWGYPYVLEQFRFHLSLTGPIEDHAERARVLTALTGLVEPIVAEPVPVRELCLFVQPDRATPFRLTDRFPFAS